MNRLENKPDSLYIDGISYSALGIGYFKKLNSFIGLNIWYYFNGELYDTYGNAESYQSVDLRDFYEISLQVESPKYFYCGAQLELGYLFYTTRNSQFNAMEGLFLKGTINILSFGLNY